MMKTLSRIASVTCDVIAYACATAVGLMLAVGLLVPMGAIAYATIHSL